MSQFDVRRKRGTSTATNGHLDVSRVHGRQSEQLEFGLTVPVCAVTGREQRRGELIVDSRWNGLDTVDATSNLFRAPTRSQLGQLAGWSSGLGSLSRCDKPVVIERDFTHN